jgi:uncharacterized protein (TIGR02147 family)
VPPLIEYTDYRIYLKDCFTARKSSGLPTSNRWFAQKMNVNSSSWLTSILQGQKNLSSESANKISLILKHTSFESRFFEALVLFNQARTLDKRNQYYQEIVSLKRSYYVKKIEPDQYDFYSNWYHSVIRSYIGMHGFDGDYNMLASMISPPLSAAQAKKSVELLLRLGLISVDENQLYTLTDRSISTGSEVRSLAISNFHMETMRLAQESIDRYKQPERNIATMTLGISEKSYEQIQSLLAETRKKIAEIANNDDDADRVYQINFQTFPLSRKKKSPKTSSGEIRK